MPHICSALLPNSPLILPGLNGDIRRRSAKIRSACDKLAATVYARQASCLVWIAVHTDDKQAAARVTLLQAPSLAYDFTELADMSTRGQARIATGFTHHIKEAMETKFPITMHTPSSLPSVFGIPYTALGECAIKIPSVFVSLSSSLTVDELIRLGALFENIFAESSERVAALACGTLSLHQPRLAAEAKVHDQAFQQALQSPDPSEIINLESRSRARMQNTLWAPTVVLSRLSAWHPFGFTVHALDASLGVGLIVAEQTFT